MQRQKMMGVCGNSFKSDCSSHRTDSYLCLRSGIAKDGLVQRQEMVGICGFSSLDWVTVNWVNTYLGAHHTSAQTPTIALTGSRLTGPTLA